jgi:aldehyde dehydrogenase (NAD+)
MLIQYPEKLYIDGIWTDPSSSARIDVINCATEELFERVAEAKIADVQRAVAAARMAFDVGPWPRMTHLERATYMRRIADALDKRSDAHARIWTSESGVLFKDSAPRIPGLSDTYRYYADLAATYPFQERHNPTAGGKVALVVREPVGVVAAIVPWNGAPGLITNKVAPALVAGCTIVLKASPEAPGSAYLLAEACEEAGLPGGVLNILTADREVSETLVAHPGIDKVTFTGSTVAGRRIASVCGERIARCTLELGGKSPAIILDDFDVGEAAKAITSRATFLTGQVCWSITRVIVSRRRQDALVEAMAADFKRIQVGDPFDPKSGMGPLALSRQLERVEGYIAKGQAEGCRLVVGGKRPKGLTRGFFIEPTIFGNVDNAATIAQEEIFGPVLSVIGYDSEDQVVSIANDTIYGLNAVVFSNDIDRAYAIARGVRAGTVGHNAIRREPSLPFGGFKQSGLGREGGQEGIVPYTETKVLILEGMPTNV